MTVATVVVNAVVVVDVVCVEVLIMVLKSLLETDGKWGCKMAYTVSAVTALMIDIELMKF